MNIAKESFKIYKNNFPTCLAYSMMIGFIFIVVLILGYYFPLSFILTIPFVVIPFIYSMQLSITHIENDRPYTLKTLILGYKLYFSNKAFGCYGVLFAFLKGAIAFIVAYFIVSTILTSYYLNVDHSFLAIVQEMQKAASFEEYVEFARKLVENKSFIACENITMMTSLLPATFLFFHHILVNSFKAAMTFYAKPSDDIGIHKMVFKQTFRYFRKEYYKDYYASLWFVSLLFIGGYIGGSLIGYFFIPNVFSFQIQVLGLAGLLIAMLLFMPYIFICLDMIYRKYRPRLYQISVDALITQMEKYLEQEKLTEQEKKILEDLKKSRDEIDVRDENKVTINNDE